jgi:membrane associated rhomboid family serine protease
MMGTIAVLLLIANFFISYRGFNDRRFYEKYRFRVAEILGYREYIRLISSGFLHVNWMHLILNMLSLVFFSGPVEGFFGPIRFLVIYFASLLGGDLLSLFIHRRHGDYSSVGSSAAVSGIIFASIALVPGMTIGFFFIPLPIPAWLYGLAYILYSIYGIRSKQDNIGHESHLGGALIGMLAAIAMYPALLSENLVTILLIGLPALAFIIMIIAKPHALFVDNLFYKKHHGDAFSVDHKYNLDKQQLQNEVDRILDKINRSGMKSLTEKEKQVLKSYSEGKR